MDEALADLDFRMHALLVEIGRMRVRLDECETYYGQLRRMADAAIERQAKIEATAAALAAQPPEQVSVHASVAPPVVPARAGSPRHEWTNERRPQPEPWRQYAGDHVSRL
jgi:hypothetical protein